jgi:glycosyltransferase involved in cell wall biosynthesis
MMAGKCLLVNSEVINSDWIRKEGIGYISPYADVERFISVLRYLHEHRQEMEEKGACARKLFEMQFNRSAMDKRLFEIAVKALEGKAGRQASQEYLSPKC